MTLKKLLLRLGIGIIIVLAVVSGVFYYLFFGIPNHAKKIFQEDNVDFRNQSPLDYLKLINSKKLVLTGSFYSNKRNPVSEFSYDNQYKVWIYKFPDLYTDPVRRVVNERYTSTGLTRFISYVNVVNDSLGSSNEPINIWYLSGRLEKLTEINLNLYGKEYHTNEKNDTLAYYSLKLNNFSITNSLNGDNIIYVDANDKLKYKVPVELMFFKKLNNIYLIILTVEGGNIKLDQGILHKLILGRYRW